MMPERNAEDLAFEKEVEAEFQADEGYRQALLNFLPWSLREQRLESSLEDEKNWPDWWVTSFPELRFVVLKDPLFFDLARRQVAYDLDWCPMNEDGKPEASLELLEWASELLTTPRPSSRGKTRGRIGIEKLVQLLADDVRGNGAWGVRERREPRWPTGEQFSLPASDLALAEVIAEKLRYHCFLVNFQDDALSVESIRAILGNPSK